jgi:hypothetical protein
VLDAAAASATLVLERSDIGSEPHPPLVVVKSARAAVIDPRAALTRR